VGNAVSQALRDASYAADGLQDGRAASTALTHQGFDMILPDLGLAQREGLSVLRRQTGCDSVVVAFALMPNGTDEDRLGVADLEHRHIARSAEGNDEFTHKGA
jgi:two-component system OmpR family response regulator